MDTEPITPEGAWLHGYCDGLYDNEPCAHATDPDPEIRSMFWSGMKVGEDTRYQKELRDAIRLQLDLDLFARASRVLSGGF